MLAGPHHNEGGMHVLTALYYLHACRKLTFKKGTLPAKKLEEMGPVIKELK
jgi:hypothetical protein